MSATTATADAQTWVFPPGGAPTPPVDQTSNFGPVHLGDSMVLDWDSSTSSVDEIDLTCFSQAGDNIAIPIAQDAQSPITYTFNTRADQEDSEDLIFCHVYFNPSSMGNSVVWQFVNERKANPVTWSAGSGTASSTSSSTTATSTSTRQHKSGTSSMTTSMGTGVATMTPAAQVTSASSDSGLSTGAKAGIGVGVAIVAVLLIAIGVLSMALLRKKKRKTRAVPQWAGSELDGHPTHEELDGYPMREAYQVPVELDSSSLRDVKGVPNAGYHTAYQVNNDA